MNDVAEKTGFSLMPYPGLRPFTRNEADIFFGRDEQVYQLLNKLEQRRFLAVVGSSGSGKSSLVRAGLISSLEAGIMASAGSDWIAVTMKPGNSPVANLAACLLNSGIASDAWRNYPDAVESMSAVLSRGPQGVREVIGEAGIADGTNLLIVIDQFEEIFRFHEHGDQNESLSFVDLLLAASQQKTFPVYVVLTMRSDFLGNCSTFPGLPEAINEGQFLVPRLSREQCREAIVGPAAGFGASVEDALVNRILNDMRGESDQLPLMQHALMVMWIRACRVSTAAEIHSVLPSFDMPPVLTLEDYDAIGGVNGALSGHLERVISEFDAEECRTIRSIFSALTERSASQQDTRRPATVTELAGIAGVPVAEIIDIADRFREPNRSFLVPPPNVQLEADSVVDISHESLIRKWNRLSEWVDEEANSARIYRRLTDTARLWHDGQAALWRTPDLENGVAWRNNIKPNRNWAARYGGDFENAIQFLSASEKALEEETLLLENLKRRKRQAVFWTALLGILAPILIIGIVAMAILANKANAEKKIADQARQDAFQQAELATESSRVAIEAKHLAEKSAKRSADVLQIFSESFEKDETGSAANLTAKDVLLSAQASLESSELDAEGQASLMRTITKSLLALGDYESAILAAQEELKVRAGIQSVDHPQRLATQSDLALAYRKTGQIKDAIQLYEKTLQLQKEALGADDPATLASMGSLALAYASSGRFAESIALQEDALKRKKNTLGDSAPATLNALENLAVIYLEAGRVDEAVALFEETLITQRRVLGDNHADTLRTMVSLADAYRNEGKVREAASLYENSIQELNEVLGEEHPDTLAAKSSLALAYSELGRADESLELLTSTLGVQKKVLGDDHPQTLATQNLMASLYTSMNELVKAKTLHLATLESLKKKLGTAHPYTLSSMSNLATVYRLAGDNEQHLDLLTETVAGFESHFGATHPATLRLRGDLSVALAGAGEYENAIGLLEKVIAAQKAGIGRTHPQYEESLAKLRFVLEQARAYSFPSGGAIKEPGVDDDLHLERIAAINEEVGFETQIEYRRLLTSARQAMLEQDFHASEQMIIEAKNVITAYSETHPDSILDSKRERLLEQVGFFERIRSDADSFWALVRKPQQEGTEFLFGDNRGAYVETIDEVIEVKLFGANQSYRYNELPLDIAVGIAEINDVERIADWESRKAVVYAVFSSGNPDLLPKTNQLIEQAEEKGQDCAFIREFIRFDFSPVGKPWARIKFVSADNPGDMARPLIRQFLNEDIETLTAEQADALLQRISNEKPVVATTMERVALLNLKRKLAVRTGDVSLVTNLINELAVWMEIDPVLGHINSLLDRFYSSASRAPLFEALSLAKSHQLNQMADRLTNVINSAVFESALHDTETIDGEELLKLRETLGSSQHGPFHNTLGVVEYRAENFERAIEACGTSSEWTTKEQKLISPHPADLAVMAMSHFRMGNKEKAEDYRKLFDEQMKLTEFIDNDECVPFVAEVIEMFDSK